MKNRGDNGEGGYYKYDYACEGMVISVAREKQRPRMPGAVADERLRQGSATGLRLNLGQG